MPVTKSVEWRLLCWSVSKSTQAPTNKALAEEQETTIREYIDRLDKINMCACPKMIMGATNYIIYSFENCIVMIKVILNAKSQVSYTKTKTPSSRTKAQEGHREKRITKLDIENINEISF